MLENTRPNLRIPAPASPVSTKLLTMWINNPKAYYFQQAQNGLYAREAILCDVLGITLDDVKNDIFIMSENKQALQVAALKNGTVIDHIPSEKLFTVVQTARCGTDD